MATLTVGTDKQYQTLSAAVTASHDGDTILVDAGTYTNQFAYITTDITLTAVGGMVHLNATVPPPNGKAIFTTNADITINGFEFSGAKVADANGAGIRMEGGNLVINDCYFHNNENGILTGNSGTLRIDDSEFAFNGRTSSLGTAHNLYVGRLASVTITDSYFHDANIGHEIKSRAASTTIINNRIQDEGGTASYSIDVPNGGNVLIQGNVIEQGPNSENNTIIAYGAEGSLYASSSLRVIDNTIINDKAVAGAVGVYNFRTGTAQLTGNDIWGLTATQIARGPVTQTGTTFLATRPALNESHPFQVGTTPPPPPPPPPTNVINGTGFSDVLTGTSGNDTINGFAGDDWLYGGLGNDRLVGGYVNDQLTGGPGMDNYLFDFPPGVHVDRIFDFSSVDDTILLKAQSFGTVGAAGTTLAAGAFWTGAVAHDSTDRILHDRATGLLRYDRDGTGPAAGVQFATVTAGLVLENADFKIVA